MRTSSFLTHRIHGIARSDALYLTHNIWNIPLSHQDLFQLYYLKRWDSDHFLELLDSGAIQNGAHEFSVLYNRCNFHQVQRTPKLLLSFRILEPEFEHYPVVLVRPDLTSLQSNQSN